MAIHDQAHAAVGLVEPPQGSEGEANGEVGGVVRDDIGDVARLDAPFAAPGKVLLVKVDDVGGHDFQPRQRVDGLAVGSDGRVPHHRPDRRRLRPKEVLPAGRWGQEVEEVAPPVELRLQLGVRRERREDAQGLHDGLGGRRTKLRSGLDLGFSFFILLQLPEFRVRVTVSLSLGFSSFFFSTYRSSGPWPWRSAEEKWMSWDQMFGREHSAWLLTKQAA